VAIREPERFTRHFLMKQKQIIYVFASLDLAMMDFPTIVKLMYLVNSITLIKPNLILIFPPST
jgi:hypothetical protein